MAKRGSYRWAVKAYGKACNRSAIGSMELQPGVTIWVDRRTIPVWSAMGAVMTNYGYVLRPGDTGAYNCRPITGGSGYSRHAHGIATDGNWLTNPYIRTPTLRPIRWGVDTDMPAAMVRDIEAITAGGVPALSWGGRWRTVKDPMHFEVHVTPDEIASGVVAPGVGTIDPNGTGDDMVLKRGDRGNTVGLYQTAVARWVNANNVTLPADADITVDDVYGAGFESAVRVYQSSANLPVTGQIDGVTAANLSRYVPVTNNVVDADHTHPVPDHAHPIATTTGGPAS